MNISGISSVSSSFGIGAGIDAEEQEIMRRLKALGITPTGNKATDKAKLHQHEMMELKAEIKATGGKGSINKSKYLTISTNEIEQLKEAEKDRNKQTEEDDEETETKKEAAKHQLGATQESILNQHFLVKKKQKLLEEL